MKTSHPAPPDSSPFPFPLARLTPSPLPALSSGRVCNRLSKHSPEIGQSINKPFRKLFSNLKLTENWDQTSVCSRRWSTQKERKKERKKEKERKKSQTFSSPEPGEPNWSIRFHCRLLLLAARWPHRRQPNGRTTRARLEQVADIIACQRSGEASRKMKHQQNIIITIIITFNKKKRKKKNDINIKQTKKKIWNDRSKKENQTNKKKQNGRSENAENDDLTLWKKFNQERENQQKKMKSNQRWQLKIMRCLTP